MSVAEIVHQVKNLNPIEYAEFIKQIEQANDEYPDIRENRTPEETQALLDATEALAEPLGIDLTEYNEGLKRDRPWLYEK